MRISPSTARLLDAVQPAVKTVITGQDILDAIDKLQKPTQSNLIAYLNCKKYEFYNALRGVRREIVKKRNGWNKPVTYERIGR